MEEILRDRELPAELLEELPESLEFFPHNSATNFLAKAITGPGNLRSYKKGMITAKTPLYGEVTWTHTGADGTTTLQKIVRIDKGAKVFTLVMQQANEQHYQEITTFTLQDFVTKGIYADRRSAFRGLQKVLESLKQIDMGGSVKNRAGKELSFSSLPVVSWYHLSFKQNELCEVSINPYIRNSIKYYAAMPTSAYHLSDKGFALHQYIGQRARQLTKDIAETGSFIIGLDAIAAELSIPTVEKAKSRHQQLIRDPIDKAIKEVRKEIEPKGMTIKYCFRNSKTKEVTHELEGIKLVRDFLDGWIEVTTNRELQQYAGKRCAAKEKEKRKAIAKKSSTSKR